jgi:hypothetical protein
MKLVLAILVAATVPAVAQPVTRPECAVTIVRAPAEVREVVERWVHSEARCNTELEVRIVPTDGGLYIFARDPSGRIRERVVPDAQSAGVLVTSWIADDSATPQVEVVLPVVPVVTAASSLPHHEVEAPRESATARPLSAHWEGVVALNVVAAGSAHQQGLRGEIDVVSLGRITLGLAGQDSSFLQELGSDQVGLARLAAGNEYRLAIYAADTFRAGPVWLRATLGAGMMHVVGRTIYDVSNPFDGMDQNMDSPFAEASLSAGIDLGSRWALAAGLIGSAFNESLHLSWDGDNFSVDNRLKRAGDYAGFVGVRARL